MQDPEDQGNLPANLISLSRLLARTLRHASELQNCMDDEGWVLIESLCALPDMRNINLPDLRVVVEESFSKRKARFQLRVEGDTQWIRATHRHTVIGYQECTGCGDQRLRETERRGVDPLSHSRDPWARLPKPRDALLRLVGSIQAQNNMFIRSERCGEPSEKTALRIRWAVMRTI